jgi:hypothetical protein
VTLQEPHNPPIADVDPPDTEEIVVAHPSPVFVDSTGRRRRMLRKVAYGFGALCMVYGGLISVSLAGGPVSSNAVLPLPDLADGGDEDEEKGIVVAQPSPTPEPVTTRTGAQAGAQPILEAFPTRGAPVPLPREAQARPPRTTAAGGKPTRTPTPTAKKPPTSAPPTKPVESSPSKPPSPAVSGTPSGSAGPVAPLPPTTPAGGSGGQAGGSGGSGGQAGGSGGQAGGSGGQAGGSTDGTDSDSDDQSNNPSGGTSNGTGDPTGSGGQASGGPGRDSADGKLETVDLETGAPTAEPTAAGPGPAESREPDPEPDVGDLP